MSNPSLLPENLGHGVDPWPLVLADSLSEMLGIQISHEKAREIVGRLQSTPRPVVPMQTRLLPVVDESCTLMFNLPIDFEDASAIEQMSVRTAPALARIRDVLDPVEHLPGLVILFGQVSGEMSSLARELVNDTTQYLATGACVYGPRMPENMAIEEWVCPSTPNFPHYVLLGELNCPGQLTIALKLAAKGLKVVAQMHASTSDEAVDRFWQVLDQGEPQSGNVRELIRNRKLLFLNLVQNTTQG